MAHALPFAPVEGHAKFARIVAKRAPAIVERAAGGGGGGGAASAAAAEMASWSQAVSEDLNIALALGVALLLVLFAPLAANWVANNRFTSGWRLRSVPTFTFGAGAGVDKVELKEASAFGHDEKTGEKLTTVQITDRPLPLRIAPVSSFFARARTVYNRTLLPTSPFFSLTWGQVAVCVIYEGVVAFCLFYRAADQRTNWKRSGCVSVAQLPALFLLATKNNLLSSLGKGYEKLNYLHRVAGRLVILCGLLHTLLFLLKSDIRWDSTVHKSGLVCTLASCHILVTSVSYFRKAFYQAFLISHIAGWISFVVALIYHVPSFARPYTAFCLAVYGVDILARLLRTRFGAATIVPLPGGAGGGMTMLQSHRINVGWRPGQHVWLRCWLGWRRGWETHPYTVANAPMGASPLEGSHNLTLLVKSAGDYTRALNKHAAEGALDSAMGRTVKCAIEGPYGGPMFTDFADTHSALLFAGGSGITFCASTLEELVGLAVAGHLRTRSVTLVWVVRDVECLEWYQAFLTTLIEVAREKTCLDVRVVLHVTNPPPSLTLASPIPYTTLLPGRPSPSLLLNAIVDEVLDSVKRKSLPRGGGIVVGTCGPKNMVEEVRRAIGGVEKERAVQTGGIVSYSETFGW
ncbi:hypothetical protein JCM10213_002709 [Rhodosporidiobolus nylandii]